MKQENNLLNPSEKEVRFVEWCKKENIKRFLFDLDDTICPTRQVFRKVMSKAYDFLAINSSTLTKEHWKNEIEVVNNRLFEQLGVNPNRWDYVVDELSEKYFFDKNIKNSVKSIFQQIYKTPLTMLDGAEEGLEFISKIGIPIGIVTHAGLEWTSKKYGWLGLDRFLKWEDIFIVNENGHKTSKSWAQAIQYFNLNVDNCVVIGDSPRSDINPVWELGVRHCFLVDDLNQWSVHNQPVDPNVYKINRLNQIPDVILGIN